MANSTAYGIFVEINCDDAPKPEPLNVYGPDGECQTIQSKAIEQPGKYFHPLLAVLITGAARLMLALAERLTLDHGLEWVFCDTDGPDIIEVTLVGRCIPIVEKRQILWVVAAWTSGDRSNQAVVTLGDIETLRKLLQPGGKFIRGGATRLGPAGLYLHYSGKVGRRRISDYVCDGERLGFRCRRIGSALTNPRNQYIAHWRLEF